MTFSADQRVQWAPCNIMGVERGTLGTVIRSTSTDPGAMVLVEWDEDKYRSVQFWAYEHELEAI